MWYVIGAVVIVALAFWYFSASPAKAPTASTTQIPSDNTTAAISTALNQTSDGTAELNAAAASSAQAVQGF